VTARAEQVLSYLASYVRAYRDEYARLTAPRPTGAEYPKLQISPYLSSSRLDCYLATDGAVIADATVEPPDDWHVAGGPALMVDTPTSRVPISVTERLKRAGIYGQSIGIYRIVAANIPDAIWQGALPAPEDARSATEGQTEIRVAAYPLDWLALIRLLTFGAFGLILDLHLPTPDAPFWNPHIIRDLGFTTADRERRRFFHYLELVRHRDDAAWDVRAIWTRVHLDVKRDFGSAVAATQPGGQVQIPQSPQARVLQALEEPDRRAQALRSRAEKVAEAIDSLESLVRNMGDENALQRSLEQNPILLDVYAEEVISKPRFTYPPDESPLGKEYVEPDFLVRYPGREYRLIELERPSKRLDTRRGEPAHDLTQAAFQIAEWRDYLAKHYYLVKDKYPGISSRCRYTIVISQATKHQRGAMLPEYLDQLRQMFPDVDVVLYDDLIRRAHLAYATLLGLAT
jgi:hypothetical protein